MCQIDVKPEYTGELKKCSCCGKELPLSHFSKRGTGYRNVCMECEKREAGATDKFKDLTIAQRIHNIVDKAKVPYAMISQIINSIYGKESISVKDKLELLEKKYGIQ